MATVPEAILCTKESNEKCRNLSYQILYALGRHSGRLFDSSPEDSMKMFFNVILAGLAGTPHMVSATIGALARLVYEFTDLLGSELVKTLLSGVGVFFTAKVREVVRSVLVFIKVIIPFLCCIILFLYFIIPFLYSLMNSVRLLLVYCLQWNWLHMSRNWWKRFYHGAKMIEIISD
jgi:hypothetical protein